MKKFLSFVLSILMIMSCSSMVMADVTFEGGKTVAYEIGAAEIGDKIAVPVNLVLADSFADDIGTGKVIIKYDSTKLAYDSFEKKVGGSINVNGKVAGTVQANVTPDEAFTESTTLLVLYFTAIEGATGDVELTFDTTRMNAVTAAGTRLDFQVVNGKVSLGGAAETPKYEVTFDGEDAQEYEEGTEITLPTPEAQVGKTFRGWSDGTNTYTGKYTVTGAVAFTSVWEINKYDVDIVYVKHAPDYREVEHGGIIILPTPAAVEGFTFKNWVDDKGNTYNAGDKPVITSDTTFTAVWEEIGKFTVTYVDDKNGTDTESVYADAEITLPTPAAVTGFTFKNWVSGNNTYNAGDKVTVTADITFTAVWDAVKYTVKIGDNDAEEVAHGTVITLPNLTDDELSFKGWKVNGTDEIVAGGATYTVTAAVTFTAVWGGGKKVYLDTTGDDANDGLTKDTPVKTLKQAMKLIVDDVAVDNTLDTIVVVNLYEKKNESGAALQQFGKGAGKKVYITGLTADAIFDMRWYDGTTLKDSHIRFNTDVEFNNIKFYGASKDGGLLAMGSELTFGENVVLAGGSQNIGAAHYDNIYSDKSIINIDSGTWSAVHYAGISGAKVVGTTTLNFNGGKAAGILNGHGWRNNNIAYGANYININGGEVGKIDLKPIGTASVTSYAGLRYFTINDGTIGNVTTTGNASATYKDGETDKFVNATIRDGVTVFEVNGGTVGKFATCGEDDDATRVIINNANAELTVEDTGAIVLNVKNGKLHATTTGFDETYTWGTTDALVQGILDWAKKIELAGFTYEADGEYNAVKVGDKTYMLADLAGDLIPAPEAGTYNVEFLNVYTVVVNGETYHVQAGEVINLERLPQNGDLKHIGWATTEGATEATINHTAEYTVTGNATLYPVWAEAVYFTVTFETAHGTAPEAISVIDDDEDGKADEEITFPGFDGKQDEHFTFVKWTLKDNAEVSYNAGATLVLEGNIVVVAEWAEDAKGTVTYRNESGEAPESYTEYVGTEIVIAECPAVEGFEFLGWISNGVTYQPGEKVTIEDEFGITFTAKWGVKLTVNANGAKGEAPVIGGTIGEVLDLTAYDEGALTKVNNTFIGWALTPDGEVLTSYTVTAGDTLYAIWEETVADAGIIKTAVTYYTGSGNYLVDVYFYGKDANTVAFGYAFGENLEFVGFTAAEGLSGVPGDLEIIGEGYYAYAVTDEIDGKIGAADKTEEDAIHLGTIAFTYTGAKEDYETDCEDCNIAITAPADIIENISSDEYFLYTPTVGELSVIGLPVVFDEAIEIEIIDVVYTLTGSVKVVREDGTAPKNYATIKAINNAGLVVKTFTIEDEATVTTDGVFNYSIELPEGEYTLVIDKIGYMPASVDVEIVAQEGADEEGFVPTPVEVEAVELIAGDVVETRGVIDLLDFAAITSSFGRGDLTAEQVIALDINEDGVVNVDDLNYVKSNFGVSNAM